MRPHPVSANEPRGSPPESADPHVSPVPATGRDIGPAQTEAAAAAGWGLAAGGSTRGRIGPSDSPPAGSPSQ